MLLRVAVISLLAVGCVKHLPPTPTPEPVPLADSSPVEPGKGRLIVDVVDGPTPVREITMRPEPVVSASGRTSYRFYEDDKVICETTPCVIDRPAGNLILGFPVLGDRGMRIDMVHISTEPSAYRRSLAIFERKSNTLGIITTSVGAGGVAAGAALLPIGLAKDIDAMTLAGGISLAAGALLTTLGIVSLQGSADVFRPGSSIHYPL